MGERILPATLILAIGIVAYREIGQGNFPPRPFTFVGVALIFTILALVSLANVPLAAAFGAAVDIGLLVKGGPTTQPNLPLFTNQPQTKGASAVGV
jgi:hypothetical protein